MFSQCFIIYDVSLFEGNTPNPPRPRFNSCRSEPRSNAMWITTETTSGSSELCSSVFSSTPSLVTTSVSTMTSCSTNSLLSNGNVDTSNVSPLRSSTPLENGTKGPYLTSSSSSAAAAAAAAATAATSVSMNGNVVAVSNSTAYTTTPTSTAVVSASNTTISSSSSTLSSGGSSTTLTEKPPMIPSEVRSSYRDQPASGSSPPTRDKLCAEDKARRRSNHQQGEHGSNEKLGRCRISNVPRILLDRFLLDINRYLDILSLT